jgi:hypothetical protein
VCVSAFFLILSFTLFYSFGYKYDFETGKSYQTGAMVLKAVPTDVVITKDGEEVQQSGFLNGIWSSFVKIEDLETKSYGLKVNKEGYFEWQKSIPISAGVVGKYESIVLLKKNYALEPAFPDVDLRAQKKVWAYPEKNKIVFRGKINYLEGLFVLDLGSGEQKMVLDKQQMELVGEVQDVRLGEDDSKLLVKAADKYYVVDLGNNNMTYLISEPIGALLSQSDVASFVDGKYLVYGQNGTVAVFDYVTKKNLKVLDGVQSFYTYQGDIYYFKAAETARPILYSLVISDPVREVAACAPLEGFSVQASFTVQKQGGTTLLLSASTLYLIDGELNSKKINSNVKKAQYFQGGRRVLYSNDNEIWIYYTEDKVTQPLKSKGENELLTRFSNPFSNIYLYADEEHLFFQVGGAFFFTELDGRDWRNTFNLFESAEGDTVYYARSKNAIYTVKEGKLLLRDLKED